MLTELRIAYRGLRRSPSFAVVAVLTLALGIGASTAVFSVVNTVLLRPLPFAEPDRLVFLLESRMPQMPRFSVAPGNFMSWLAQNHTFERMAAIEGVGLNLTGGGRPESLRADRVSADLFAMLGIQPRLGRFFSAEEDQPGAAGVVVLSEALWRGRFGGDPAVLGQVLTLSGRPHTVVGVAPSTLGVVNGDATQVWVPIALGADRAALHSSHFLRVVGQLKAGASLGAAHADLERVAVRLEAQFPDSNKGWRVLVTPLQQHLVRNVRTALTMLSAAVMLVLLVVCANIASLMLARGLSRQKEMAVRSALGAERGRLAGNLCDHCHGQVDILHRRQHHAGHGLLVPDQCYRHQRQCLELGADRWNSHASVGDRHGCRPRVAGLESQPRVLRDRLQHRRLGGGHDHVG